MLEMCYDSIILFNSKMDVHPFHACVNIKIRKKIYIDVYRLARSILRNVLCT